MKEETNKVQKETRKGNIVCYVFILGILLFTIYDKLTPSTFSYSEQREKKSYVIKVGSDTNVMLEIKKKEKQFPDYNRR